jgi:hypothetical protein
MDSIASPKVMAMEGVEVRSLAYNTSKVKERVGTLR